MKNTIVLKKVSIKIDGKFIIKNISFSSSPGKPLCIIGTGSSGKSSLLKSILGLIKLSSGTIYINGKSIEDKKIKEVFDTFGVVFQKDALFDSLTVWENIMFRSLNNHSKEKLISKSYSILKKVGLAKNDAFLFPAELSGGMRKRVAIARAISHQPNFLLLDEPLAGIDPIALNEIRDLISQLKDHGLGVLITDHNVRETLDVVDRTYIIHDGAVLMEGTPSEVVKHSGVREVYLGDRFSI